MLTRLTQVCSRLWLFMPMPMPTLWCTAHAPADFDALDSFAADPDVRRPSRLRRLSRPRRRSRLRRLSRLHPLSRPHRRLPLCRQPLLRRWSPVRRFRWGFVGGLDPAGGPYFVDDLKCADSASFLGGLDFADVVDFAAGLD